jgi:hypothetical protein
MAGIASSAVNLNQIQLSKVLVSNSTFINNTGAFSFLEKAYHLPFYEFLTMKTNLLNFISQVPS